MIHLKLIPDVTTPAQLSSEKAACVAATLAQGERALEEAREQHSLSLAREREVHQKERERAMVREEEEKRAFAEAMAKVCRPSAGAASLVCLNGIRANLSLSL